MHDEEAQRRGAHGGAPPVHQQQPREALELADADVARQRGRPPFRAFDADAWTDTISLIRKYTNEHPALASNFD